MGGLASWRTAIVAGGLILSAAACSSYPSEPRYSIYPVTPAAPPPAASPDAGSAATGAATSPDAPVGTAPAETGVAAPVGSIEGGALPPAGGSGLPAPVGTTTSAGPVAAAPSPAAAAPTPAPVAAPPPPSRTPGAAYVIQPGDTISGVGRRFQTPVQTLIDLNGLGPRGQIATGQRVILPDSAVDTGPDPYATGPSPVGVLVPDQGAPPPPPPPPPSGNPALPPPSRTPATETATGAAAPSVALQWPVRGEILRRFGPVGLGERNNGINIGASAGAAVNAAAAGRVAYVGDDLVGQGLTVLIVHRDGWRTVYGHLGSATVRDGDEVRAGQQVGTVGLTAGDGRPSIHFETRHMRGDDPVAVDPLTVLPR